MSINHSYLDRQTEIWTRLRVKSVNDRQKELVGSFKRLLDYHRILMIQTIVIVKAGILIWSGMEQELTKVLFFPGSPTDQDHKLWIQDPSSVKKMQTSLWSVITTVTSHGDSSKWYKLPHNKGKLVFYYLNKTKKQRVCSCVWCSYHDHKNWNLHNK